MNWCPGYVFIPYALFGAGLVIIVWGLLVVPLQAGRSLTAGYARVMIGMVVAAAGMAVFFWVAAPYPRGPVDVLRCLFGTLY